jgi:DNA-binding YbaB/EbfC family protein
MSNPFDLANMGGMGGMGGMLGGLAQQMEQMKAEAAAQEVEGSAGGGLVRVVATGALEVVAVHIDPKVAADTEMLEDLLVVAINDALQRAQGQMAQSMQGMLGGLGLPPGMF